MNAKQMIAKLDGYGGIIPFNSEELEVTLRALRLLDVIDGAAGETPAAWIEHHKGGDNLVWDKSRHDCTPLYTGAAFAKVKDERNGLAARVAELEGEVSAADIYGRTSASHGFINAPKWNELADETKQLYREAAARSKP